jgi:hypothetical protein
MSMTPAEAVALVPTDSPRNDPPATRKDAEGVGQAVNRLAARLRERLLQKVMADELEARAVQAMVSILEGGKDRDRVELLKLLWSQLPVPGKEGPIMGTAQTVVAIQVNGSLRRGRKEFA